MSTSSERIAIFAPDLGVGGAERSMLKLVKGLLDQGYAVDLVLSRAFGPLLDEVPRTAHLVDLKAQRVLSSLPALIRYLRREQPIVMLSVMHANLIAIWARTLAGVPTKIVVSERNTLSSEVQHYSSDIRYKLIPTLTQFFYPWADAIVAVSKGVADDLIKNSHVPKKRIHVIYNPVVTPELRQKALMTVTDPWYQPGEPPVILSVGRLEQQKDFPTLIRAFANVSACRSARLMILGDGQERSNLEALIDQLGLQQEVRLPGYILNPYPYMSNAALFVLTSRWEGLPGVLIEAMYCGSPLIATDCPSGPREILANGQYGRLIPVGNEKALATAMCDALDGLIPRPPPESWKRFEQEKIVDEYIQVLMGENQSRKL
jgi:glycosyltransferase involved in cell wall biosynthesis